MDVFNKIENLKNKLKRLPDLVFSKSVVLNLVEHLNFEKQLFKEKVNADNEHIGFYSKGTELINPLKKEGTPYTLKDTGYFYDSAKVFQNGNGEIEILAYRGFDDGTDIFKYGDNILGLTNDSKEILANKCREEAQEEIRKALR